MSSALSKYYSVPTPVVYDRGHCLIVVLLAELFFLLCFDFVSGLMYGVPKEVCT